MDMNSAHQQLQDFDEAHSTEGPGIWVPSCGMVVFPDGAVRSREDSSGLAGWVNPQPCADMYQRARLKLAYWEELVARGVAAFEELRSALRGNGSLPYAYSTAAAAERELRNRRDVVRGHQAKVEEARAEVARTKPDWLKKREAAQAMERGKAQALREVANSVKL